MSEKKRSNKRLLKLSIILYILLIALVGVFSVAWFITNKRVEVGVNEKINITVGNNLEFALIENPNEETRWLSKIAITPQNEKGYPDITGGLVDGKMKFYYPTVLDDDDKVLPDSEYLQELTGEEGYYIQLRLRFRTAVNMGIYLSSDSYVKPINVEKVDSTYGDISTDYIAGAARVAFSEVTSTDEEGNVLTEELRNVWVPNDGYQLYYEERTVTIDNEPITTMKAYVKTTGERERFFRDVTEVTDPNYGSLLPYGYLSVVGGNIVHNAWKETDYASKLISVGNDGLASVNSGEPAINSAKDLLNFSASDGNVQEKDMIVRIWFEGTDREADKALNGGKVNYNLVFEGIDKKEADSALEQLNLLEYKENKLSFYQNGTSTPAVTADNLLYSYDGITWTLYNDTANNGEPLRGNEKDYVYVKVRETKEERDSAAIKITRK